MLLTPDQVLELCEKPRFRADIDAGRVQERRHRLHVDGPADLLTQFIDSNRFEELTGEEVHKMVRKCQKAATKPLYGSIRNILSKVLTASGTTYYYEFNRPDLGGDFNAYLADTSRYGTDYYQFLHSTWDVASLTGFQGYFLEDLPSEPELDPAGFAKPFTRFVPSEYVWDALLSADRVEYLILRQVSAEGIEDFFAWDDMQCHRARLEQGKYYLLPALNSVHGLGRVPACPPTRIKPDISKPVRRSSQIADSIELADVYLDDFIGLQLTKKRHIYPRPWSYGVPCDHTMPASNCDDPPLVCTTGWMYQSDGSKLKCPRCNGQGRYIPLGPDRGYIVQAPTSKDDPDLRNPAGYIVPDIKSAEFIKEELAVNRGGIEQSVLGKEGILTMLTKVETAAGKDMDLGPMYDRLGARSGDLEYVARFLLKAKAELRYTPAAEPKISANYSRRYQVKSEQALEARFVEAKKGGLDDSTLYSYLEDIIYTKYQGDPMELQRNLLKLELTPFPTQTVKEAKDNGIATPEDLALKQYLNDFVSRFERENGSILDFGAALPRATKIERILEQFTIYLNEKKPNGNGTTQAADPARRTAGVAA